MRIDRGLLNWGVFLVLLGAIPLAVGQGWLPRDVRWWELWPLILVGIGIGILLRRTTVAPIGGLLVAATFGLMIGGALASGPGFPIFGGGCIGGTSGTAFPSQDGTLGGQTATVRLEMGCGDLTVTTASGNAWRVTGTSDQGRTPSISRSSADLTVRSSDDQTIGGFFRARSTWEVTLPTAPRLRLSASVNAGSGRIDLGGADLEDLELSVNAGDGRIDLSGATALQLSLEVNAGSTRIALPDASLSGDMTVNAGSIAFCVPPDVALRLRTNDNITASYDYGRRGLVKTGNTWQSSGWDTATKRIDLSTTANAGSFALDPQGGCR